MIDLDRQHSHTSNEIKNKATAVDIIRGNGVQHTNKLNYYTKNITKNKKAWFSTQNNVFFSRKSRVIISYKNEVELIDTQNTYK
jgi:hypothetical protein